MKKFNPSNAADEFFNTAKKQTKPAAPEQEAPANPEPEHRPYTDINKYMRIERKDKHIQLLFPTSVYNGVKEAAERYGVSMNELMLRLVEQFLEDEERM